MSTRVWAFAPLAALALCALPLGVRAQAPAVYRSLPSNSMTDGRMFNLGGVPLQTLAGDSMSIAVVAPPSASTFEVGIFDGDTGKDAAGALNPQGGMWDGRDTRDGFGSVQVKFRLYADPDGIPSPADFLVGEWMGNDPNPTSGFLWSSSSATMPDDGLWNLTVQTSPEAGYAGGFRYRLEARLSEPASRTSSNFKVRATAALSLAPEIFGLIAARPSALTPTPPAGYDGTFDLFFSVPGGQKELVIWDGDADQAAETDDQDTAPEERPQGEGSSNDLDEGVRPGSPSDVGNGYDLIGPAGLTFTNLNPSGNREWEKFRVKVAGEAGDADAIIGGTQIPPGLWRIRVRGQDISNNFFLRVPFDLIGAADIGDTVFHDTDGDGVQEVGEPGIAGVKLTLQADVDRDGILDYTTTDTTDADGTYLFTAPIGGRYTVLVDTSTVPGGLVLSFDGQAANQAALSSLYVTLLGVDFGFALNTGLVCPIHEMWPPNHALINVGLGFTNPAAVASIEVWANEDDEEGRAEGRHSPDAKPGHSFTVAQMVAAGGVRLRRERAGDDAKHGTHVGRVYLIVVILRDGSVQVAKACAVSVPHDQSPRSLQLAHDERERLEAIVNGWTGTVAALRTQLAAEGLVRSGDGPVLGPTQ